MTHSIGIHRTLFLAATLLLLGAGSLSAADVALAWDASTSENIAGYRVYVGTAPGAYSASTTIGNQTTYTVTGLGAGAYYFAVKAFNAAGYESDFSNEVSTTITGSGFTCDLNGDSGVNALDLQRMVNIILGLASGSASFDLNSDGKVDVLDLQILNNVVLGLRSCS